MQINWQIKDYLLGLFFLYNGDCGDVIYFYQVLALTIVIVNNKNDEVVDLWSLFGWTYGVYHVNLSYMF